MPYTCTSCKNRSCTKQKSEWTDLPKNCPMRDTELFEKILAEYSKPEINCFYVNASMTGNEGKAARNPRIVEMIELCRKMGYHHIGIACCTGWAEEAELCAKLFRKEGFLVESVICSCGSINEADLGVPLPAPEQCDAEGFSLACNPVGQAMLLNKAGTEFNILLGLCVGHDSLFLRYTNTLTTVLTVKERRFAHNPIAGIYYAASKMKEEPREK